MPLCVCVWEGVACMGEGRGMEGFQVGGAAKFWILRCRLYLWKGDRIGFEYTVDTSMRCRSDLCLWRGGGEWDQARRGRVRVLAVEGPCASLERLALRRHTSLSPPGGGRGSWIGGGGGFPGPSVPSLPPSLPPSPSSAHPQSALGSR